MFTQARLKFTLYYIVSLGVILGVFSLLVIHYNAQHIRDTVEEDSPTHLHDQTVAEGSIKHLENTILFTDTILLGIAALLAYVLAKKTLEPIQNALDAQEKFSAHASHELRTPLAVMRAENEVFLKEKHTDSISRSLAESNLEEIKRMTSMVESLLVLARSSKKDVPIELSPIDLTKCLEKVIQIYTPVAEKNGNKITLTKKNTVQIKANEKLLEVLFGNLVQNAIMHTKNGHITIHIENKPELIVTVKDTGEGIEDIHIKNLFDPFYKVDSSRNTTFGGVGLGLSIVKEIAKEHDAKVVIQSKPLEGTMVSVIFPSQK